jgi:hypothetical protein
MATPGVTQLRALMARHRRESTYVTVALAVLVASVAAGLTARDRIAAADTQRNRLRSIEHDMTTFRAAFRQPSLEERAFRLSDSLAVAVARDARFSVAQRVAQRAEQLGLTDVRVRFAPADSDEAPATPELSGARIAVADYSLGVDCRGDLAALLSLVDQLPPSVALQRLAAERSPVGGAVDYHLALAVFESSADTSRAVGGADDAQQVAQLLPYAVPPRDSDLAIRFADAVSLTRDPFVPRSLARIDASPAAERAVAERAVAERAVDDTRKEPAASYHVTTTLMAGARRAALINDQLVYVGESLPDGSKLTAVERDRVVLTDHRGVAHTVAVAREGES